MVGAIILGKVTHKPTLPLERLSELLGKRYQVVAAAFEPVKW